jgi:antitoxin (DNA-binding transcriptional repressor) of toxin-antitoxin stability system
MVVIDPDRMFTVTDARPKLNALVTDAQNGLTTHIVSGGQVVAHLVPARTWIADDQAALELMLAALIREEVARTAKDDWRERDWTQGKPDHVGDVLGRVLGWTWRTDPERIFMPAVTDYTASLARASGVPLTFQDIRLAMARGLGGGAMSTSEIAAALAYAEQHWDKWALPSASRLRMPNRHMT